MTMTGATAETFRIPVSGGELYADLSGDISDSTRAPLILLHGWTLDRHMWAPQIEAFSNQRPVIAFDRRGFGQSTAPAAIHLESSDIIGIQEYFGVRNSIIVGMSQAGQVAIEFAVRYPKRLSGLVLEGASLAQFQPPPSPDEAIPIDLYREMVRVGNIDEMRAHWRNHPLMKSPNPKAAAIMGEMLLAYDGRDLLAPSHPFGVTIEALDLVKTPVLAITGDLETSWRREVAQAIADRVKGGRYVLVDNAGHVCNLCNPDAFNTELQLFLESQSTSA